jgi:hypothetical protein
MLVMNPAAVSAPKIGQKPPTFWDFTFVSVVVTFLAFVTQTRYFESFFQDQNFVLNFGTKTLV